MNIKLDTLQTKRQQYKKHLQRLSNIYHEETGKKKILKQSRSVDKLIAITHRIHETSNRFRFKKMQKIQMQSKSKDWGKSDCSFLPTSRMNHEIIKNQKRKHELREIEKQNKFIFDRLLKVKPTIANSKSSTNFTATSKNSYLPKPVKVQADFSTILNSSIIRPEKKKVIEIKLHSRNQEILKIKFSKEQQNLLQDQNFYFLEVKNNNGKMKESLSFYGNELFKSQICIFKQKGQNIEKIELRFLANQTRAIPKGYFRINPLKAKDNQSKNQQIQFVFTNKNQVSIKGQILVKNLKMKTKKSNKTQRTNSNQVEKDKQSQILAQNE